jgi:hypothetical protein
LSLGAEYALYQTKINPVDFEETNATFDIFNNPIIYHTGIDRYSEKQVAGLLNIPVSVLYQAGNSHKFYISAGIKIGFPVFGKYNGSSAVLTAWGYYPDYNQTEIWQNDLGYGIFNLNESKKKLTFGVSLMGAFETGIKWNIGTGKNLYTGVFVDYGFNNMLNSKKHFIEYNHNEPNSPVVNTACALSKRFSPLSFGLKVKLSLSTECRSDNRENIEED